ncbi:UPF0158 family protein [Pseudomonas aeruginosa]
MDELAHIKQLILQLLASKPYEFCARLKQRLNHLLIAQGGAAFDERKFGSKKFSEFLLAHLEDRLNLEKPVGSGDIRVSLKPSIARAIPASAPAPKREQPLTIRSDVWQAFTNPDAKRKRYFNRTTGTVLHFVEGIKDEFQQQLESAPHDYAEIEFIPPATQQEWMREFLGLLDLPTADQTALESLIAAGYSSSVNAAFTKALDTREQEWRKMRTLKITERIQAWATQHSVKLEELSTRKHTGDTLPSVSATETPALLTPRQQAAKLLELMSDEDIAKIAIPVLLSSVLSKSQI